MEELKKKRTSLSISTCRPRARQSSMENSDFPGCLAVMHYVSTSETQRGGQNYKSIERDRGIEPCTRRTATVGKAHKTKRDSTCRSAVQRNLHTYIWEGERESLI